MACKRGCGPGRLLGSAARLAFILASAGTVWAQWQGTGSSQEGSSESGSRPGVSESGSGKAGTQPDDRSRGQVDLHNRHRGRGLRGGEGLGSPSFVHGRVVMASGGPPPERVAIRIDRCWRDRPQPQDGTDSKGHFSFNPGVKRRGIDAESGRPADGLACASIIRTQLIGPVARIPRDALQGSRRVDQPGQVGPSGAIVGGCLCSRRTGSMTAGSLDHGSGPRKPVRVGRGSRELAGLSPRLSRWASG